MKIENTQVFGFESALRGMRNPMNSHNKSDSEFFRYYDHRGDTLWMYKPFHITTYEMPEIGTADMKLACKLIKGGSEHRKFLRQIMIWVDFTLPRYIWTEIDTYKVATIRNSCSTMHKLGHRSLTKKDFEDEMINFDNLVDLNELFKTYKATKDFKYLRIMKGRLPESFLQKATFSMNYETALTMFHQRKGHRLPEWNVKNEGSICQWILSLPHMKEWTEIKKEK